MSSQIPLLHGSMLIPFFSAADKIGIPMQTYLREVGLPEMLLEDTDIIVSELPAWRLVQKIAKHEGIKEFSALAIKCMGFDDFIWQDGIHLGCLNLHDLIKRFCIVANLYSSKNKYELMYEEHQVSLYQKSAPLLADDEQIQIFEVIGLIQLVQICTGKQWRPDAVGFTFSPQREINNFEQINPTRINYLQRFPYIRFSRETLSLQIPSRPVTRKSDLNYTAIPIENRLMPQPINQQLQEIISPYLGNSELGISKAAELVGLSSRTLQRRLADIQMSYSEVIQQARMKKASELLISTDIKLIDICIMLGFENPSSFTRAFVRWAGIAPKYYRKFHQ
jgi:AraC-like DNA-binding protein